MKYSEILKFTGREQNEAELLREITNSNVICLVYSVDDDKSIDRVRKTICLIYKIV